MYRFKNLIYLLGFVVLFSSCSKDDEEVAPQKNWEDVEIGLFAEDARQMAVPEAMQQSEDMHAYAANLLISSALVMPAMFGASFIMPQEGAEKRSVPITASNARMAASEYWVYELGTDTASIAYQFYEEGDQQFFQIFINSDNKGYFQLMEIAQNKDGKEGVMKMFDDEGGTMVWTWEIRADESYYLTYHANDEDDYHYEIISNKDLSGSIKTFNGDKKQSEWEWDSTGNGSWKEYDDNGSLMDEGAWTV